MNNARCSKVWWGLATSCTVVAALAQTSVGASHRELITLHYSHRPPLAYALPDGTIGGLVATPAAEIFKAADVPFVWTETPFKRTLALLEANQGRDCTAGSYWSPERAAYAKASKPFYRDPPFAALVLQRVRVPPGATASSLINSDYTLLIKKGFTYGSYLGPMLRDADPKRVVMTVDDIAAMVKTLRNGLVDVLFLPGEEAEYYARNPGPGTEEVRHLKFPDVPNGDLRHILCSRQVSDETMRRLNAAIKFDPGSD